MHVQGLFVSITIGLSPGFGTHRLRCLISTHLLFHSLCFFELFSYRCLKHIHSAYYAHCTISICPHQDIPLRLCRVSTSFAPLLFQLYNLIHLLRYRDWESPPRAPLRDEFTGAIIHIPEDPNKKTPERLEVFDFTENVQDLTAFVSKIEAKGGDDTCEDVTWLFFFIFSWICCDILHIISSQVLGGLEAAMEELSWESGNRVLLHILGLSSLVFSFIFSSHVSRLSDAPPHGRRFHTLPVGEHTFNDDYPNGHKDDPNPDELIRSIGEDGIHYTIVRVMRPNREHILDKMIDGLRAFTP